MSPEPLIPPLAQPDALARRAIQILERLVGFDTTSRGSNLALIEYVEAELATLCGSESPFVGHPTRKVPGVEQNTGALGHGLPLCTGMAIGGKMDRAGFRVFTLLGDGELAEGSNWEAAMAAAHYKLDNLTAIVDRNTLQITGRTRDVMSTEPLEQKFAAFGWAVRTVDGHDLAALTAALSGPAEAGKPTAVIAQTTKGRGVSFMEDVGRWHHGVPNDDEDARALAEIDAARARMPEEIR